jgi:hypothetical protein
MMGDLQQPGAGVPQRSCFLVLSMATILEGAVRLERSC